MPLTGINRKRWEKGARRAIQRAAQGLGQDRLEGGTKTGLKNRHGNGPHAPRLLERSGAERV